MLKKVISGGQTGADQGGLEAGKELGLETGGTAPKGWKTEKGPEPILLSEYGLVEAGAPGYPFRTSMNVQNSDATVIFGDPYTPGTNLTRKLCIQFAKPWYRVCREDNPRVERTDFLSWIEKRQISKLNVAGNRESKNPGIQGRVKNFLVAVLKEATDISLEEWKKKSEEGEVCGILGCPNKPAVECKHCRNWYCEEHKFVIRTPAHPQLETKLE